MTKCDCVPTFPPNAICGGTPCGLNDVCQSRAKGSAWSGFHGMAGAEKLACWGTPFIQNCGSSIVCEIYDGICNTLYAFMVCFILFVAVWGYFYAKHAIARNTPKQGGLRACVVPAIKMVLSKIVAVAAMYGKDLWTDAVTNGHGIVTGVSLGSTLP